MSEARERLVRAIRGHTDGAISRTAAHGVIGVVKAKGSSAGGLKVHVPDHDFLLDGDDLFVSQAVGQYDEDYGLKVGDSLLLVPLGQGDYVAAAALTDEEPTPRRWDGLLIYGTSAPTGSDGRDGDFYIRTNADPDLWRIYGPKASGAWPAGVPIRGPIGATGPAGTNGTNGTNGSNFLTGAGPPAGGTGVDGDSYLDYTSGYLYAPKAAGVWPAGTPIGVVVGHTLDWPAPARSIPARWLACFGQSLLRATYPALFAALCPTIGAATVTIAAPGVWTFTAHGLVVGDPIFITTTGALPTGLAANTTYYVMTVPTANTFTLGTTRTIDNITGIATVTTAVNTTGTQSGVHTILQTPHGVADATHFNAPDYRGRDGIGKDDMGGTAATRLSWTKVTGLGAGEEAHLLVTAEAAQKAITTNGQNADHTHGAGAGTAFVVQTGGGGAIGPGGVYNIQAQTAGASNDHAHTITGSSAAASHNNVPPGIVVNKIIFAGV